MALDQTKNFAKVTVSTGYDNLATSIVLNTGDGARLPDPASGGAFNLVWWNWTDYPDPSDDPNREVVRCTARSTDTLTVTRGQEDIAASTKNTGGKTYKMILALTAYQMGLIIAQGGNSFGAAVTIGSVDAQVVYLQYNAATRLELNSSGINIYSPRTIYTSGSALNLYVTDANPMVLATNNIARITIASGGEIGIGTTAVATGARLKVFTNIGGSSRIEFTSTIAQFIGSDAAKSHLLIDAAGINPYIYFRHSAGTFAAQTATNGGNFMGGMQFQGYDGSAMQNGGYLQMASSYGVNWAAGNRGTELWLQLCPVNTTTPGVKMVVKGNGEVTFTNNASVPGEGTVAQINAIGTKDAMANLANLVNYQIAAVNQTGSNGLGAGIAMTVTTAYTANITAAIIGYRVSSNAQGRMLLLSKQSTTGGAAPVIAMVIDEAGKVKIDSVNGTASARFHIIEPTIGNEVLRIESVATNDDVAEKTYQGRVATIDATVTTILTLATIADSVKSIDVRVVARRTGGVGGTAGDVAGYSRMATFKNIAGTVTQVGTTTDDHTAEDQAGWDVTFTVSGTNVLVQVTGAADNNITWHATARVYELST